MILFRLQKSTHALTRKQIQLKRFSHFYTSSIIKHAKLAVIIIAITTTLKLRTDNKFEKAKTDKSGKALPYSMNNLTKTRKVHKNRAYER
jgi:hypothetical protein